MAINTIGRNGDGAVQFSNLNKIDVNKQDLTTSITTAAEKTLADNTPDTSKLKHKNLSSHDDMNLSGVTLDPAFLEALNKLAKTMRSTDHATYATPAAAAAGASAPAR